MSALAVLVATLGPATSAPAETTGGENRAAERSAAGSEIQCTSTVLFEEHKAAADDWSVGLSCWGNPTAKTQFVRGVLDIPGGFDVWTRWVEIPAHTFTPDPRQIVSPSARVLWGTPTSRVDTYECPPVSIGECRPDNRYNTALISFAKLATRVFKATR